MIKFYTNGDLGDVVYQLYTIKQAQRRYGVGAQLLIDTNRPQSGWNEQLVDQIIPLCLEQRYIDSVIKVQGCPDGAYNFDVARHVDNRECFFEWHGNSWPGNCDLKKRYYLHYCMQNMMTPSDVMRTISHEYPWITVPKTKHWVDIVIHVPLHKLTRPEEHYIKVIAKLSEKYKVAVIGGDDNQIGLLTHPNCSRIRPKDLLEAADLINSAKLFMGTASCCYVIAEALDQFRLVDIFGPAEGTVPQSERGWDTSCWSTDKLIANASRLLEWQK